MSDNKEYKITTIKELAEVVTTENIDTLTADIKEFLVMQLSVKLINEIFPEGEVVPGYTFHWIDDNSPGLKSIRIDIRGSKESEKGDK